MSAQNGQDPAAATVLTDERIAKIWEGIDGKKVIAGESQLNWSATLRKAFARAIEAEVLAHAGKAVAADAPKAEGLEGLTRYKHSDGNWNVQEFFLAADVVRLFAQAAAPAASLIVEARAVFDLMLEGCRDPKFGDFQNGDGEEIGPRMDALHDRLRAFGVQAGVTAEPDGWKLVPVDATPEMISAASNEWQAMGPKVRERNIRWLKADYKKMIEAAPTIRAQVPAAEVRVQALRFADDVISNAFDGGDLDGGTVQEMAEACDLITPRTMTEPCGPVCNCMEAGAEFPTTCYRKTYLRALNGQSTADKASEVRAAELQEVINLVAQELSGCSFSQHLVREGNSQVWRYIGNGEKIAARVRALAAPSTAGSANTGALGEKGGA